MLEFSIIEAPHKMLRNTIFQSMVEKMKFFQGIENPLGVRVDPVFVIIEGERRKLLGTACLFHKEIPEVQEEVADLISALKSPHDQVWECSTIYVNSSSPHIASYAIDPYLIQAFYRKLYEGLIAFGIKKNIHFIVMKLLSETYSATQEMGLWPYVIELKPSHSADGLFHGVLPLVGRHCETYKKMWSDQIFSCARPATQ